MSKPKVSVVIPAFNAQETIAETLYSLFWQSFKDFEVIVVDDGSEDQTSAVVKDITSGAPVSVECLRQKNKGPAAARNLGFAKAKGEYLIWIDADDIWLPQRLEILVDFLDTHPQFDLVTSDAYLWYPPAKLKGTYYSLYPAPKTLSFENLLYSNFVFTSTLMRRKVWLKTGGLNEAKEVVGVEDYEFWLRVLKAGFKLKILPQPLMLYRINPGGLSAKKLKVTRALLVLFDLLKKLDLSPREQKIVATRQQKVRIHLAQSLAEEGEYEEALAQFRQLKGGWAKLSLWLLERQKFGLWQMLFRAKQVIGKLKWNQ